MKVWRSIFESLNSFKSYQLGMVVVILIIAIDANIYPYLVKLIIDSSLGINNLSIIMLISVYMLFRIINSLTWLFSGWIHLKYSAYFTSSIINKFAYKIGLRSYNFLQNNLSGSLVNKINDIAQLIPKIIITINYEFIYFALTMLFILFLLSKIHLFLALSSLIWIVIFLIISYQGFKIGEPLVKSYAESKSKIWGQVADFVTNLLNVKLFANSQFEKSYLNNSAVKLIEKHHAQSSFSLKVFTVQSIVMNFYNLGFLLGLVYLQHNKQITPGDFALVFMLSSKLSSLLYDVSNRLRDFITDLGSLEQALTTLDVSPEICDKPHAKKLIIKHGKIDFNNVKFYYNGAEPLFNNKSIIIEAGQKVGLVGYSGSGKTTFANLILRLYDISCGQILIDYQNIANVTGDSLRAAIGMIPQDPSLFHRTIHENIGYGNTNASKAEIFEAAKNAHAHEFILKLPNGYNSLVGERGVKLSGGQRQRIAIARAILKDAPILILDEATSQLDSVSDKFIQKSLEKLMRHKTTIIIAYRLSTLMNMDRILVFDCGKIVEDGTHSQLLKIGGLYKTLWNVQIGGFLDDN